MLRGREGVDDDQPSAAAWAWQCEVPGRLIVVAFTRQVSFPVRWFGPEQVPDPGDIGGTVAVSVEAVVADAVLAFWQNVDQEPADEL